MKLNVPNTLRQMNASVVLNVIRENSPLSRAQIAKVTGITKATISEIVSDLLEEKIIYESGVSEDAGLGRKGILVNFDPNHGLGIGTSQPVGNFSICSAPVLSHLLNRIIYLVTS